MEGGITVRSNILLTGLLSLPLMTFSAHAAHKPSETCQQTAYENLGWQFYHAGDYQQALTVFQNTLTITPRDVSALRGQAYSLYQLKQYNIALLKLPEVIALERSFHLPPIAETTHEGQTIHLDAATLTAWCYYAIGQPKKAKQLFRVALSQNPRLTDAYTGLGYTAIALNRRGLAETSFKQALHEVPHYQPAVAGLKHAKALSYGMHFNLNSSYGRDSLFSPYQHSVNTSLRIGYNGFDDHFNVQSSHDTTNAVESDEHTSSDRTTFSWAHLVNYGMSKRLGFRMDLAQISHSQQLYDNTWVPYFAMLYLNRKDGQYFDFGVSQARYKQAGFGTDVNVRQFSATTGHVFGHRKFWGAIRLMDEIIQHPESTQLTEHLFSASAMLKWQAKPELIDVSWYFMGGERQYAYNPYTLNVTNRWDRQIRSFGIAAGLHCCHSGKLSLMLHKDTYDRATRRNFSVDWVSLGFNYHI